MLIARATLAGQTYQLHQTEEAFVWDRVVNGPPLGLDLSFLGEHPTLPIAIDDLWAHLGLTVAVETWWKPVVDGLDISAARRPVTVTEQEMILADSLSAELWEIGLALEAEPGTTPTRAHRALAHRQLQRHYEQLTAEDLLEQVALAHDLECELIERGSAYEIVAATESAGPSGSGDAELLAAGDTPLAAVLELQRDLDAAATVRDAADGALVSEIRRRLEERHRGNDVGSHHRVKLVDDIEYQLAGAP
jgi:hypothetical protein